MKKILVLVSFIFVFTSIGAETVLERAKRKLEEMNQPKPQKEQPKNTDSKQIQNDSNPNPQTEEITKQVEIKKQIDFYSDHKKNEEPVWINKYFDAFTENISPIIQYCPLNDTWKEAVIIDKNRKIDNNILQIQIVYKDIQNNIVQDPNFNRVKQDCKDKVKVAITFLDANKPDEIQKKYNSDLDDFNKFTLAQQKEKTQKESARVDELYQKALKDAYAKGINFAKESGVTFKLFTNKDEMTGKESQYALQTFKSQEGATADVIVKCTGKDFNIIFKINSLNVPTKLDLKNKSETATGRANINGNIEDAYFSLYQGDLKDFYFIGYGFIKTIHIKNGALNELSYVDQKEKYLPIHTFMLELKTYKGNILAKIPPYDAAVNTIIRTCK